MSFAHEYLRKRVPHMPRSTRFWLSLCVPIIMRVLGQAIVVPPRSFFKEFHIPRSVRRDLLLEAPATALDGFRKGASSEAEIARPQRAP